MMFYIWGWVTMGLILSTLGQSIVEQATMGHAIVNHRGVGHPKIKQSSLEQTAVELTALITSIAKSNIKLPNISKNKANVAQSIIERVLGKVSMKNLANYVHEHKPIVKQNATGQAIVKQSTKIQPSFGNAAMNKSNVLQSAINNTITKQSTAEQPDINNEIVNQSIVEYPVVDNAIANKSTSEQRVVNDTIVNKLTVEQPVIDNAIVNKSTLESVIDNGIVNKSIVEQSSIGNAIVNNSTVEPVIDNSIVNKYTVEQLVNDNAIVTLSILEQPIIGNTNVNHSHVEQAITDNVSANISTIEQSFDAALNNSTIEQPVINNKTMNHSTLEQHVSKIAILKQSNVEKPAIDNAIVNQSTVEQLAIVNQASVIAKSSSRPVVASNMPAQCMMPLSSGYCSSLLRRFFYNSATGECERFYYGGCGGNNNRFSTFEECHQTCTCAAPAEAGQCVTKTQTSLRWFYNKADGLCKTFTYSGCGGNQNNYGTIAQCIDLCTSPTGTASKAPEQLKTRFITYGRNDNRGRASRNEAQQLKPIHNNSNKQLKPILPTQRGARMTRLVNSYSLFDFLRDSYLLNMILPEQGSDPLEPQEMRIALEQASRMGVGKKTGPPVSSQLVPNKLRAQIRMSSRGINNVGRGIHNTNGNGTTKSIVPIAHTQQTVGQISEGPHKAAELIAIV